MRTFIHLPGDSYPADAFVRDELAKRLDGHWITLAPASLDDREPASIERRIEALADFIDRLDGRELYLVGRSSGARVITQAVALSRLRRPVRGLICLGYPFRHPKCAPEPERFRHLAELALPALILQGRSDAYGGLNVASDYVFSAQVKLEFIDTEHALKKVWPHGWDDIARRMAAFLQAIAAPAPVALTPRRA